MFYKSFCNSPIGKILIVSDEDSLCGVWFEGQKYFLRPYQDEIITPDDKQKIIVKTKYWLENYFNGDCPNISDLKLSLKGSNFYVSVWRILQKIPYGQTATYGEISKEIADIRKVKSMSAQAVGNAIGHNPISIIIPCHRVVSKNGNLTGYAAGIDKKMRLLQLEKTSSLRHK